MSVEKVEGVSYARASLVTFGFSPFSVTSVQGPPSLKPVIAKRVKATKALSVPVGERGELG